MSPYNIHQQVALFCYAVNIALNREGTQDVLFKYITDHLQPIIDNLAIGNWKIDWLNVWKVLPKQASGAADHVWFAAHNPAAIFEDGQTYDTYVVSIASTAKSALNRYENHEVGKVVDFEEWVNLGFDTAPVVAQKVDDSKPYVSLGTATGVHWLYTTPNHEGVSLAQFLRNLPATSRVVFTGGSMAGTLSPSLAMAIVKSGLTEVSPSNIFTYPICGCSPGNGIFAQLYADTFPRINAGYAIYEVWNSMIWNTYDVVPHAWNINSVPGRNLSAIPTLYGELPKLVEILVEVPVHISKESARGAPVYVPLQGTEIAPKEKPITPTSFTEFLYTMAKQHYFPYLEVIGIPCIPEPLNSPELLKQIPIFSAFEKAREEEDGAKDASVQVETATD